LSIDDLTWTKTKNLLLTAAAGLVLWLVLQIQSDVSRSRADLAEIKVSLATSQANYSAMEKRVDRVERIVLEARR
jgi:hypothetical protein